MIILQNSDKLSIRFVLTKGKIMEKINVCCDSSCDLPQNYASEKKIKIMYIPIIVEGEEYKNVDNQFLFDSVAKTGELPKTAAPSTKDYENLFESYPKNENVIYFSLSSHMSLLNQNANEAAKSFKNVKVIDSLNLSSGIAMQVMKCIEDIESGLTYNEVLKNALTRQEKVKASFVIDKLTYLYKGGRCSALALFGANLLKIKPEISVVNGKMGVSRKFRGKLDAVIKDYVELSLKNVENADKSNAFIDYTAIDDETIEYVKQQCLNAGFKNVYACIASSTIAVHCGEGTLGIMYMEK